MPKPLNIMVVEDHDALRDVTVEALSQTKRIGVMATRGTLASQKFKALKDSLAGQAEFICQPCDGLADAIERNDTIKTIALCTEYTRAIGQFGLNNVAVGFGRLCTDSSAMLTTR